MNNIMPPKSSKQTKQIKKNTTTKVKNTLVKKIKKTKQVKQVKQTGGKSLQYNEDKLENPVEPSENDTDKAVENRLNEESSYTDSSDISSEFSDGSIFDDDNDINEQSDNELDKNIDESDNEINSVSSEIDDDEDDIDDDKDKSDDELEDESDKEMDDNDECVYKFTKNKKNKLKEEEEFFDDEFFDEVIPDNDSIYVPDNERITKKILTKYERVNILGTRANQIASGAKPIIKLSTHELQNMNPIDIAKEELKLKIIPFIVVRTLPNGKKERFKIKELDIIN